MKKVIIYGGDCRTKEALFKEFDEKFNFPEYFSYNWDSFDEIICDLSWIPEEEIILNIVDYQLVLEDESDEEKDIFFDILSHVEDFSGKTFLLEFNESEG